MGDTSEVVRIKLAMQYTSDTQQNKSRKKRLGPDYFRTLVDDVEDVRKGGLWKTALRKSKSLPGFSDASSVAAQCLFGSICGGGRSGCRLLPSPVHWYQRPALLLLLLWSPTAGRDIRARGPGTRGGATWCETAVVSRRCGALLGSTRGCTTCHSGLADRLCG